MRYLLALLAAGAALAAVGGYQVVKRIPAPGDGEWNHLTFDPEYRRLYVSHGAQVDVIDADTGASIGKIADTRGVRRIVVAEGRVFTSNDGSSNVGIYSPGTFQPIGIVKAGKKPDAIVYDSHSSRIFCFNGGNETATVFGATDRLLKGVIRLDGAPESGVADGEGHIFVNLADTGDTLRIASDNFDIQQRWPVEPCIHPSTMAMDREHKRLFIGCRNKMMAVLDAEKGNVVTTLPIGDDVGETAYDPATRLIFNANGEGTITVIHQDSPDSYSVVETVRTQRGAKTLALDPKTHKLYLPVADRMGPKGPVMPGTFTILVVAR